MTRAGMCGPRLRAGATGLSLLRIDRESDQGVYREPNVWMRHR